MRALRRSIRRVGAVVPLVVATACTSGNDASPSYETEVRDGVQVVTTHRAAWSGVRDLVAEPRFTISSSPGEGIELSLVRDAILLDGGGVALLDSRLGQVIEFDSSGRVHRVLGRRGEGPGEFTAPLTLSHLRNGSVAVYDQRTLRVTSFSSDSSDPTVLSLDRRVFELPPARLWLGPDGEVFSVEGHRESAQVIRSAGDVELIGASAVVRRTHPEAGTTDTLFRGGVVSEMVRHGTMLLTAPFGRSLRVDVQQGWMAIAESEGARVHRIGPSSEYLIASMPGIVTPLARDEVDRLRDSIRVLSAEAGQPFMAEPTFSAGLQPDTRPAFGAVHLGPTGWIILEEFQPIPRRSSIYWVVSPEGRFLGRLRIREGSEVLELGANDVVLLQRDQFDLPAITVARVDWQALLDS